MASALRKQGKKAELDKVLASLRALIPEDATAGESQVQDLLEAFANLSAGASPPKRDDVEEDTDADDDLRDAVRCVRAMRPADTEAFWEWLSAPLLASGAGGSTNTVALLGALWLRIGDAACALYWSLLAVPGAERRWGVIFRPGLWQQGLARLRSTGSVALVAEMTILLKAGGVPPNALPAAVSALVSLIGPNCACHSTPEPCLQAVAAALQIGACTEVAVELLSTALRGLLPALLMWSSDSRANLATASAGPRGTLAAGRDAALNFAKNVLRQHSAIWLSEAVHHNGDDKKLRGVDVPLALVQQLLAFAPDRQDWRASAATTAVDLFSCLVSVEQSCKGEAKREPDEEGLAAGLGGRLLDFLGRLLHSERTACRSMATETLAALLNRLHDLPELSGLPKAHLAQRFLGELQERATDVSPTVRTRAFQALAAVLPQLLARFPEAAAELLGVEHLAAAQRAESEMRSIAALCRAAACDEKASVRKAAAQIMTALVPALLKEPCGWDVDAAYAYIDVELLDKLAQDVAPSVRKAAISTLGQLFRSCPSSQRLRCLWAAHVAPLCLDDEKGVSELALEELSAGLSAEGLSALLLAVDVVPEAAAYARAALRQLAKQPAKEGERPGGALAAPQAALFACAEACLRPAPKDLELWPLSVWDLLGEACALDGKAYGAKALQLALDAWQALEEISFQARLAGASSPGPRQAWQAASSPRRELLGAKVLDLLIAVGEDLPAQALPIAEELVSRVLSGGLSATQVPSALHLIALARSKAPAHAALRSWPETLKKTCLDTLAAAQKGETAVAKERLCATLVTLGEAAIGEHFPEAEACLASLQCIIAGSWAGDEWRRTDPAVRGHAVAALGKCSVRSEISAKRSVDFLAALLCPEESLVVRSNALLSLGDVCVVHSTIVDRYVPHMTLLLSDESTLLRKHAVMVLSALLGQDFLKCRGSTQLRLLRTLGDSDNSVRDVARVLVERILLRRDRGAFLVKCFPDLLCGLAGLGDVDPALLLPDAPRRASIYSFLLGLLSAEQRLAICIQLAIGPLAAMADGAMPESPAEPKGQVLSDCLAIAACCEMHRGTAGKPEREEGAEEEEKAPRAARVQSSQYCELLLPVLRDLRERLERQRSPLLAPMRKCLVELFRDVSFDPLPEGLEVDPQLLKEIIFDARHDGLKSVERPSVLELLTTPLVVPLPLTSPQIEERHERRISLGATPTPTARAATATPTPATAATPLADRLRIPAPTPLPTPKRLSGAATALLATPKRGLVESLLPLPPKPGESPRPASEAESLPTPQRKRARLPVKESQETPRAGRGRRVRKNPSQ